MSKKKRGKSHTSVNPVIPKAMELPVQETVTESGAEEASVEGSMTPASFAEESATEVLFAENSVAEASYAEESTAEESFAEVENPIREVLREHSFYAPRASEDSDWDEDEEAEEEEYNRASVNRLKKAILVALVLMFLIPTILCLILLTKMHGMKDEIEQLREDLNSKRQERMLAEQSTEDETAEVDVKATLERDREDKGTVLHKAGKAGTEADGTEDSEGVSEELTEDTEADTEVTDIDPATVPEEKRVYLTFDDGPSDDAAAILDVLKEKNVKATFFMVIDDKSRQSVIRRMAAEGHTLGIHSVSHVYSEIYADLESFQNDVQTVHDLLKDMTGQDVKLYRFPGGSSNRVSDVPVDDCIAWLEEEGYTYFDWNASNGDSSGSGYTAEQLEDNVLRYVHNNSGATVVLMHDFKDCPATAESLPHLIDTLREEGYVLLPIDENTTPVHHRKTAKELEEEQKAEQAALEAEKARREAMAAASRQSEQDEDSGDDE